jgi:nucleoside-diphosphate-sugar epimerase
MYGEGDPYHISALLEMAEGWPYVRIGKGRALCQHIYVGNVAHALLQAASAIEKGNTRPCGEVYFLTDSAPSNFFHFFDTIVEGSGYRIRPKNLYIPAPIMLALGYLFEFAAFMLRPLVRINPKVSRFAVWYTCNDFTFSSAKAERDFGYRPKYHESEAVKRSCNYFREFGPVRKKSRKKETRALRDVADLANY